jgi:NAD/NADP transhydrogenase beta subunit
MILGPHIIELSIILFLLYWLVGGVFFAIIALFRSSKIRKAQFSCLFTLASIGWAVAATIVGTQIGGRAIRQCLRQADGYFSSLASVISCGVLPLTFAALVGFLGLIFMGLLLLVLSRSRNQSWVDERAPDERPLPGVQAPAQNGLD